MTSQKDFRRACLVAGIAGLVMAVSGPASAQEGPALFANHCAICHEGGDDRAPGREVLGQMTADQILQVLEKGAMRTQAAERSRAQRRVLAEYVSGKKLSDGPLNPIAASAFCQAGASSARPASGGPSWNGWGVTLTNSRFQGAEAAGLTKTDIPRLKLKWAFGYPGATSGGTQPVVYEGRLYVGTAEGDVWALDAQTGCIYWRLETEAAIRSAITIEKRAGGALVAYFGDQSANAYAIDAQAGKVLWKVKVDDYARSAITGAPQLYQGRLYVPVSSREESQVGNPRYPCCKFRGSVVALDATTGKQIWKTYTISDESVPTVKNRIDTLLWGPSGSAVWTAPTIDTKRRMLYVGTSNNYSTPATQTSDAVVAIEMDSGKINWVHQLQPEDVWNGSCRRPDRDPFVCPDANAPDIDFSASPVLVDLNDGKRMLVAGNKGGTVLAFDPDQSGKVMWERQLFEWRIGDGGSGGGYGVLWGVATDGENVYAANGYESRTNPEATGGMAAVAVRDGRVIWRTPAPPCLDRKPCKPTSPGAVTAIPGVAFAGSFDGQLRAYSTDDGKILWEYNSLRDYDAVNGVKANGGSMSNAGPTVVGGMLYMNSGYSHHGGVVPGNVLLAFSPE